MKRRDATRVELLEQRRHRRRLRAFMLIVGAFVLAGATAAFAYFTVSVVYGSGNYALATANSLSAPTAPTATVNGSGAITIGWTLPGSQLPGAQYKVTRTSGPGSPTTVCTVASNVTSCQDTGLTANTTYGYSTTAVLQNWQSSAITKSATTATPTFTIAVSAGPYTAGSAVTVQTITAKIGAGTDTTYTGAKTINWSGLANSPAPSNQAPSYPSDAVTFTNGVATPSSTFTAYAAGSNTLTATDANATSVTGSATITVNPAGAAQLAYTQQPSSSTGAVAFGTQPKVAVQDAFSNTVTTDSSSVTLAITAGTPTAGGPGTLTCTANPKAAVSGVATFAGCKINTAGTGYKLHATDGSLTATDSSAFNITVGSATQLAFTQSPSNSTGGIAFGTQPIVAIEDAGGNIVTTDSSTVTLSITSGTPSSGGPGTLTCATNPLAASGGVASFSGCAINTAGTGYKLHAIDGALTATDSSAFNITVGAANKLAFTQQPGGGANGAAWATQPKVSVQDAGGNTVTTSSASITLAINSQPGAGATLTCTTNPLAATSGVASFAGCQIVGTAGSYTLSASATGLTTATSNAFNITFGAANKLAFTQQPGGGANGAAWSTQPAVTVQDSGGNTVTTSSASITLAVNSGTGTVTCTTNPLAASSGVANFAGCQIVGTAGSFTLQATATGLSPATSNSFSITAGAATQLAFTTDPGGGANAATWATQPVVKVEDSGGNVVTSGTNSNASITLAINTQPGAGATITCTTNPLTATSGVASFAGCQIVGTAGSYTLSASATGLTSATSNSFNITFGAATQIVLSGSTADLGSGATRTFTATIVDSAGNTVTSGADATRVVTFSQTAGTGSLTGLTSTAAVAGVRTDTVTGNVVGPVTLRASATLTQGATNSNTLSFNVTAAPTVTAPTAASPCNPGHNGTANCVITGTNFEVGVTVTISANGHVNTVTRNSSTQITINVTGSGGNGGKGNLTVTNPDGGSVTVTNGFSNG